MASLALIVSFLFLFVFLYGFMVFGLSGISYVPNFIIILLGLFGIIMGFWWLVLPIGLARIVGGLTIMLSILSIKNRF